MSAAEVIARCRQAKVEVRPWFMPLHHQKLWQSTWPRRNCRHADDAWHRGLSLPCSTGITTSQLERSTMVIRQVLAAAGANQTER